MRWWIHEVKLQQILHSKRLEKKDNIGQVCPLNFWHRGHKQFIFVRTFREKPKTLTENKIHKTSMLLKLMHWKWGTNAT